MAVSPRDLVDEGIAAGALEWVPDDVVTEESVGYYGEVVVRATARDRAVLEDWITDWFIRWHPDGYSSYTEGVVETPVGFVVTLHRARSCE